MATGSSGPAAPTAGAALQSSLRSLGATLLGIAHTRLELLSLELEDEKQRLLGVLAWGALAVVLGGLGLVFLAAWLTVLWWETHRLLALGACAAVFLALTVLAVWKVRGLMRSSRGWLAASLAELEADRQALAAGLAPAAPVTSTAPATSTAPGNGATTPGPTHGT